MLACFFLTSFPSFLALINKWIHSTFVTEFIEIFSAEESKRFATNHHGGSISSEDFVIPHYPKSDGAIQFIDNALADNFIFASLSQKERRLLIDAMMQETVPAGSIIIQQGNIGDFFYVVDEGYVSFSVDGNHVGSCSRGASFGELALLYNCPRAATCIATSDCRLWKVDQHTFRHMLANNTANQQKDILYVVKKVPFLAELDDSVLTKISDALTSVVFQEGERIINKGDGEVFYIIREGTVKVHDIGFGDSHYVDQYLGQSDWFGERALLTGEPRVANVTATSQCVCLCLSRDTFEKTLDPLQDLIDHAMKKRVLVSSKIPCFVCFSFHNYTNFSRLLFISADGSPHM
jgi:cAMP-dependent protein kinase regulator